MKFFQGESYLKGSKEMKARIVGMLDKMKLPTHANGVPWIISGQDWNIAKALIKDYIEQEVSE